MKKVASLCILAVTGAALTAPMSTAQASEWSLTSKFNVSFLGLNVGRVKQYLTVSGSKYTIQGGAKANRLVSLISNAKANYSSAGTVNGNRLVPSKLDVAWTGRKSGKLSMGYDKDRVASIEAMPKIKYKSGTVPVKKEHLSKVLDPVSSLIFAVDQGDIGNGRKVCNRTLPIFDGRSRMNLSLSYKSSKRVRVKGFKGKVHTCAVRYQPVSGIRPAKKNIKFMKANRDMEVTMARVGNSNFYALFAFRVRTTQGIAKGSAYQFSVN